MIQEICVIDDSGADLIVDIRKAFMEKNEKIKTLKELEKEVIFSVEFFGIGESQSSRFVTSWATKEEDVDKFVELIKAL